MRTFWIISSLMLVGCGSKSSVDTGSVAAENEAPRVAISAPADGVTLDEGMEVTIYASVSDDYDAPNIVSLTWESTTDGDLEGPNADVDGAVVFNTVLNPGTHTVTVTAMDTGGLQSTDSVLIKILADADADGSDDGSDADGSDADGSDADGSDVDGSDADGSDADADADGSDSDDGADSDSDADSGADDADDGGTPTVADYTECTHSYDPVDVLGWTKTYDATFIDDSAIAIESSAEAIDGWGSDRVTAFAREESLIQDGVPVWSGSTYVGCGLGDVEGMFTLGWTHEVSVEVEDPALGPLDITDVYDFSHSDPRMYLNEVSTIGSGDSWDFEYDMAYPAGSTPLTALFIVPVSGSYTDMGMETIEVWGTTYEAWHIRSEYTMDLLSTGFFTRDYPAEADFWYVEDMGLVKEVHTDIGTGSVILRKELMSMVWDDDPEPDDVDADGIDADADGGDTGWTDTGWTDTGWTDTGWTDTGWTDTGMASDTDDGAADDGSMDDGSMDDMDMDDGSDDGAADDSAADDDSTDADGSADDGSADDGSADDGAADDGAADGSGGEEPE